MRTAPVLVAAYFVRTAVKSGGSLKLEHGSKVADVESGEGEDRESAFDGVQMEPVSTLTGLDLALDARANFGTAPAMNKLGASLFEVDSTIFGKGKDESVPMVLGTTGSVAQRGSAPQGNGVD